MHPVFKNYLWGGDRLIKEYHKPATKLPVAESWELSCHPDGESTINNGAEAGRTLGSVLDENPQLIGAGFHRADEFPILIKFIDAKQPLSLQVHPDDAYARLHENQYGKNEMWYVVDCGADAELIIGLKQPLAGKALQAALSNGAIVNHVNRIKIKPGDCYGIPAGTLHGIGKNTMILEVQQNSNVTYRAYDYDRLDADGKKRPLHIRSAVEVLHTGPYHNPCDRLPSSTKNGASIRQLSNWKYFFSYELKLSGDVEFFCKKDSFHSLTLLNGRVSLERAAQKAGMAPGETLFIPAGLGRYRLTGKGKALLVSCSQLTTN
jgi:mannose-6-phosphate isomerase